MRVDLTKVFAFSLLFTVTAAVAATAARPRPVAYQTAHPIMASGATAPWILTALPRASASAERAMFAPIAHYLTAVTGHKVVYQRPSSALAFAHNLAAGRYDLVFGGPHLAAWAARHVGAHPLVRFAGRLSFDTVARDPRIHTLADLVGEPVCVNPPPSLATMTLLRHFPDVLRQPYLVTVSGWHAAYHDLESGSCQATVMPAHAVHGLATHGSPLYVIHTSRSYPGYGLVAGRQIPSRMRKLMRTALLSPAGQRATLPLVRHDAASRWVVAHRRDYAGLGRLLRHAVFLGG